MPVSYPASLPTSGVTSLTWTNSTSSLISRSPFSFQGQAQSYGGGIRSATITVDRLSRIDAEDWIGFLDSLNGTMGTFLFGDPHAVVPMGAARGSGHTVASIIGNFNDRISIQGPIGAVSTYFRRGDWIQLGEGLDARLYKINNQVAKASTGVINNIVLWPKFRKTPVVGQTVFIENPVGLFRRSNGSFSYTEDNGCSFSISFDIEEVI